GDIRPARGGFKRIDTNTSIHHRVAHCRAVEASAIPVLAGAGAKRERALTLADLFRLLLRPDDGFLRAFMADQHEAGRLVEALHLEIGALQPRFQTARFWGGEGLKETGVRRI